MIVGIPASSIALCTNTAERWQVPQFHMMDVEWGEHNQITVDGHMTVSKEMLEGLVAKEDCIEKIDIQIIRPGDHDRWTNTIMDIIPISTKVLGKLGEGITLLERQ